MDLSLRAPALLSSVAVLAFAGCGGGDDGSGGDGSSSDGSSASASSTADVAWPLFGRVLERTHYIADAPNPPFHYLWEFDTKQLIEFPPVLENGRVFVVNKVGTLYAIDAETGKQAWKRQLAADVTGPAFSEGTLYVAQLGGTIAAIDSKDGQPKWTFRADGKLESSPLIADGRVYFGDDDGHLYALDAASGKVAWQNRLGTDIKASPSFSDGTVYVGDYEGGIHAVDASSGKIHWTADTTTFPPGGNGGFYSSPSIAFGHVYEARDDGVVYAVDQDDGKLAWHYDTSNQIYGSPAAAQVPGTPASIYIGSYNHQLYALDATSGKQRWRYDVGGQVPGTPTVVGKTVYTSSFQTKKTVGLSAKSGKKVFGWGSAGYTPVISDGERAYLSGFQTVWAFDAKNTG
jgi:outer membrane protein assembly factor BamB